jgi:hypothetical protein
VADPGIATVVAVRKFRSTSTECASAVDIVGKLRPLGGHGCDRWGARAVAPTPSEAVEFRHPVDVTRWEAELNCVQMASLGPVPGYSITRSAVAIKLAGTVIPSAFAVLRLITNSNLVGCSTGRSAGFAPWRIRLTYEAAR